VGLAHANLVPVFNEHKIAGDLIKLRVEQPSPIGGNSQSADHRQGTLLQCVDASNVRCGQVEVLDFHARILDKVDA